MKTALVILAAGIGARYGGGIKQLEPVGPNGEIIMDYSIHDAIAAGFSKVVFIIRKSIAEDFQAVIGNRIEETCRRLGVEVAYAYQELEDMPDGMTPPPERKKPWGTGQALLACRDVLHEPFAVINADDFYGVDAYRVIGDYLSRLGGEKNHYCMVGYEVNKTLSENGTVSRGVCSIDADGFLTSIVERTKIERNAEGVIVFHDLGDDQPLAENTPVSMNLFGFTPDYFTYSEEYFKGFLSDPANMANLKSEFFIPLMVNKLVGDGTAKLKVLSTTANWFGVTYKADKPQLVAKIEQLIEQGVYPRNLWGK